MQSFDAENIKERQTNDESLDGFQVLRNSLVSEGSFCLSRKYFPKKLLFQPSVRSISIIMEVLYFLSK